MHTTAGQGATHREWCLWMAPLQNCSGHTLRSYEQQCYHETKKSEGDDMLELQPISKLTLSQCDDRNGAFWTV